MDLANNPIFVVFVDQRTNKECKLDSGEDLCVLDKAEAGKITVTLSCREVPCYISWELFQSEPSNHPSKESNEIAQGLYSLSSASPHVIVRIYCNDPEQKHFSEDVRIYSSSRYELGGSPTSLYVMFANEDKGFVYFDIQERSLPCATIKFTNVPAKVPYSEEPVIDFTTARSASVVGLDRPKHDVRIDCLFHMLHAPGSKV
jgi:hypothetical protein